jgi:hypothetical protein
MLKKTSYLLMIFLMSCTMNSKKMNYIALVKKDQHYGYINQKGNFILPAQYSTASDFQEGYAITEVNGKKKFIDAQGNMVYDIPDSILMDNQIHEGKVRFLKLVSQKEVEKREGDVVYSNTVVEPSTFGFFSIKDRKYTNLNKFAWLDEQFNDNLVAVQGRNSLILLHKRPEKKGWGFADMEGNLAIDTMFEDVRKFSEGLAPAKLNGLWGYISKDGKWVIPPRFQRAEPFSEGMAVVKQNDHYGLIDRSGEFKIPAAYPYLDWVNEETILCSIKGTEEAVNNYQVIYSGSNYGFLDTKGKLIVPTVYSYATPFSEGLAIVVKNDKWGAIDKQNKLVIPNQFQEIKPFSKGYAAAMQNGKWGYINTKGEWVISPQFDEANSFIELKY